MLFAYRMGAGTNLPMTTKHATQGKRTTFLNHQSMNLSETGALFNLLFLLQTDLFLWMAV